jgi:hypothetical protein
MRHKEIAHKVNDKTGEWFLNAPTFRKWLAEETSPILWCPGIRELPKPFFVAIPVAFCHVPLTIGHAVISSWFWKKLPNVCTTY